jgi:CRP-like cAMP-binding protein
MSDADLGPALRALPHFKTLPADLLAKIAATAKRHHHTAGDFLFSEGDPCRSFYAIESGAVKLYRTSSDGREQVVHNLHAGATPERGVWHSSRSQACGPARLVR